MNRAPLVLCRATAVERSLAHSETTTLIALRRHPDLVLHTFRCAALPKRTCRTIDMCQEAHVTVIDKQLNAMVKKLDDRFAEMVGQGTACLRLMHSAEMNSAKAYGR